MEPKYIFVLVAILCMAIFSSQDTYLLLTNKNNTNVLCGHVLTEALSIVCKGKYNALKGKDVFNKLRTL